MPKQVFLESRNQTLEFPDDATQEEINQSIATEFPRNGEDVAFDMSRYQSVSDIRDFVAAIPDDDYIKLNNYRADKKLSWGEMAGIAGDAIGTIVGDVVKGAGKAVTKAGDGVAESALRGVAAGTVDIVNLGQKLITPNERIPTFEEFMQTPRTQLGYAYGPAPSVTQVQPTEQDYKTLIDQQRAMELQSLDIADISEKLIQGAPVPEVARGASYLDAVTLAGLAKSVARSGVKSIYKAVAKKPLVAAGAVAPDVAQNVTKGVYRGVETGESFIPNVEQFATKVGEGARKAGLTGVQLGAGTVKGAADLGRGVIDIANKLGLESAALRGTIGGAIGYQDGGTAGAIAGTLIGSAVPVIARAGLTGVSRTADFIGAAAKVGKTGASRTGIFEKMATAANISSEARGIAEKLLVTQPFVQYAGDVAGQATKNAALGAGVGAGLGYLADGEQGAAAGAGAGAAIGSLGGAWDASYDAMKSIAGRSTARSQRNAAGDIKSFVNDIADDQARADYGEIMNRAIQVAGPERAADMLDSLRLAESMGATVKTVPPSERGKAFNEFDYSTNTITINPDRMNAGSVQHEVFHQLFNVGVRGELQKALSDVYLPKKDADGNVIQNGLFTDQEFAKKAAELAKKYQNNEKGYKHALEQASVLDNPAGFSPEAIDKAREFVIDEMTAAYTEKFMGRSRTGVFNPDRLPMWHRQILENIDDKILNRINDKMFADRSVKDPTAFFTDAEGKPVRVPQLDPVLKRAFSRNLGRDKSVVGKPREVITPKNPRELKAWATATFGATRDVLDPTEQRPLTEKERKAITAADFDAAKALYQSLPDEDKKTVRVTKKSGVPTDINSKGARIEITSQTPSNVFEGFLQVAKDRGMGNQQLANMRQLYASMAMDDGPTFDTVNNPVYKYNPKTGKMTPGVRPASRQEVYPTAITVNSAGGFNVEYIDLSRVKANAQKILDNPKYKGVWNGLNDFMTDFGSSLRNLSKGEDAAMPSAELLGKGNEKIGAMKRDLIAEAMNVTLPQRLQGEGDGKGYINQPTIDPLTLATKEGKDRRIEGSAFRDFRIERLTDVTPTNNRLKMVKENAYDIFVQRYQPDSFTPESLPNGEAYTNPDGFRILNKTGSKLFRTYDDTGKLIGVAESKEKAVKKAMDEATKRMTKEEPSTKRFQFAGEAAEMPQFMRDSLDTAKAMAKEGKNSETIRAITGWFPGKYDDKMRWEVPDNQAQLNVEPFLKSVSGLKQAKLGEILDHPSLFSAYPEAKEIFVSAEYGQPGGSFWKRPNGEPAISLFWDVVDPERAKVAFERNPTEKNRQRMESNRYEARDEMLSTLLHEVQHWIQDKEGFARGGNLETGAQSILEAKTALQRGVKSDVQIMRQKHKDAAPDVMRNDPEFAQRAIAKWRKRIPEDRTASPFGMDDVDLVAAELMDQDALLNRLSKQAYKFERLARLDAEGAYKRFAGEIESRDVQARQSFTPEQRKAIAPYSSENIAKDEAIVLKNADKAESSKRFQPVTPEQDAAYLQAVKSGDRGMMQKMVDAVAKAAGFTVGPVWHGSPDFVGNEFDLNMRGRRGMSRGGFSFTRDKNAAEAYMQSGVDPSQRLVDKANALMRQLQLQIDSGFEWIGPNNETEVPEFKADAVDDIGSFQDYLGEIANTLPDDLQLAANELASRPSSEDYVASPRLIRAFLKNPQTIDVVGKELLLAESPNQIKSADPVTYDNAGNVIPLSERFNPKSNDIRFQPDPTSLNILNGTDGSRIIKSNSGKYRVYLATGALAGVKDTLESAQKLVQSKSKSYATN